MLQWLDAYHPEDTKTARKNFIANVMDGSLFAFGMSFVSLQTILPIFVQNMGGSNISVGLIPVVWTFGFNFPQIFIVKHAQRLKRKKSLFMKTSLIQRIPWLLLALLSFFVLEHVGTDVALLLFFSTFALTAVGGSINLPVWFDLIAKLTPMKIRGRLFAVRSILGAVFGIVGGACVTLVLSIASYPKSYGILFLLAFVMMMISYWFLGTLKETKASIVSENPMAQKSLEKIKEIIRTNFNYRNFLIADALVISSSMANAFFTVNAFKRFSLTDAYAGAFTIAIMISMIFGSVVFGFIGDHYGHKLNLLISSISTFVASMAALLAPSIELYMIVFICSAFTVAINGISRLPIVAELCTEVERPTYIALTNLITSPFVLFGVGGGWMANYVGYDAVFIVSTVFSLGAVYWLSTMVKEPRKEQTIALANL